MGAVPEQVSSTSVEPSCEKPRVSTVDDAVAGSRRPRESRAYLFAITPLASAFFMRRPSAERSRPALSFGAGTLGNGRDDCAYSLSEKVPLSLWERVGVRASERRN